MLLINDVLSRTKALVGSCILTKNHLLFVGAVSALVPVLISICWFNLNSLSTTLMC